MKRNLLLLAVSILLIVGVSSVIDAQSIRSCPAFLSTGDSSRALVLLAGLGTGSTNPEDQAQYWSDVVDQIWETYGAIIFFSYDDLDAYSYDKADTLGGIDHHVAILYQTLEGCRSRFGNVTFDLIGHSMGGVTALEYMRQYGLEGPQIGWVKYVITLDSPVNGLSNYSKALEMNLPSEIDDLLYSQSGIDMGEMGYNPNRFSDNVSLATRLEQVGTIVWTLASISDVAVYGVDATIAGHSRIYDLGNLPEAPDLWDLEGVLGWPGFLAGHSQVLHSEQVVRDIVQIVSQFTPPVITSTGDSEPYVFPDAQVLAPTTTSFPVIPTLVVPTLVPEPIQPSAEVFSECGEEVASGQSYRGYASISIYDGCEDGPPWHIYLNAGEALNVCVMTQSARGHSVSIQVKYGDSLLAEDYPIPLSEGWSSTSTRLDSAPTSGDYQLYFYPTSGDTTYDFSVDINDATGVCLS